MTAAAGGSRPHASALATLRGWVAPDDAQDELRRAYVRHLLEHDDGMLVTCVPAHLTASALVLDATGERVLLTHHRKGGFWAQLGGHVEEADRSLAAAAPREGREDWTVDDIVAYSKLCTHVGCPVGLYQTELGLLLCPCHQSTFDVMRWATPIFGPAARPLPQLPLGLDGEGYIVATGDFSDPVGPGFWDRGR